MNRADLLHPLSDAEWPPEIEAEMSGNILNIHRMIAHNPALFNAYAPLRNYIVKGSKLTDRQRELLILRTAHNMQSEYEWRSHVVRGRAAGLRDDEIERVKSGADADGWSDEESLLLAAVDQMMGEHELAVETATNLLDKIGRAALLDLVYTVGVYITLGTILKTFDVPISDSVQALTSME